MKWRWFELLLLLGVGPVALFPQWLPPAGSLFLVLLAFCLPLVIRWQLTGRLTRPGPFLIPLAFLLLIALPLSLYATPLFWAASWPKTASLLWSVALFLALVNWQWPGHFSRFWLTLAYLVVGVALATVGLLGLAVVPKIPVISTLAATISGRVNLATLEGFHPNEVGGTLTLFVPLAVCLTLALFMARPGQSRHPFWPGRNKALWLGLPLITLYLTLVLLLTQSRTAWMAVGLALFVSFLLMGRLGWLLIGGAGLLGGGLALFTAIGQAAVQSLYSEFFLWRYSTAGYRVEIWRRALQAIADFPFTGTGIGTFRYVMNGLYPWLPPSKDAADVARVVDFAHAHNFFLQFYLDLGLVGLLAMAVLWFMAGYLLLRRYRQAPAGSSEWFWLIGLFGSWLAYLLFGLTDTVPPGGKPGFALWALLGLIMLAWGQQEPPEKPLPVSPRKIGLALLFTGGVLLLLLTLTIPGRRNLAALTTAKAILADPALLAPAGQQIATLSGRDCRINYLYGLILTDNQQQAAGNTAWERAIACNPAFIYLLESSVPENRQLAQFAIQQQPAEAEAYFWLAALESQPNPEAAIRLYQQGLQLSPNDGWRWSLLGNLLADRDQQAALEAYLQSCQHGDPPAGGCRAAGRLAESLGDPALAIHYYRLSHRPATRQLAERLTGDGLPEP